MSRIVISSGHSRHVAGARGYLDEVTEARKVVALVASYLRELADHAVEYHDDISRTQAENINRIVGFHNAQSRDLDLSVHFNAFARTEQPRGVEVLHYSIGTADRAAAISRAIASASGLINRGPKARTDLGFLRNTNKPALLVEVCFVDSKADCAIYEDKFEEICLSIAETVTGRKLPRDLFQEAKP